MPTPFAVSPETWTGLMLLEVELLPSSPLGLYPQHLADPFTITQVRAYPAETEVTPDPIPETSTGTKELVVFPVPSWP